MQTMIRFKRLGAFALAAILATPALIPVRSFAVDNMASGDGVDLTSVRAKIKAKDYAAAKEELRNLVEDAQHPDVYSLLGFTLRKTGDYATSLAYYTKALELEPGHKAAREYLGELFLETDKLDLAKDQLAALERLCPAGCEERAGDRRPGRELTRAAGRHLACPPASPEEGNVRWCTSAASSKTGRGRSCSSDGCCSRGSSSTKV